MVDNQNTIYKASADWIYRTMEGECWFIRKYALVELNFPINSLRLHTNLIMVYSTVVWQCTIASTPGFTSSENAASLWIVITTERSPARFPCFASRYDVRRSHPSSRSITWGKPENFQRTFQTRPFRLLKLLTSFFFLSWLTARKPSCLTGSVHRLVQFWTSIDLAALALSFSDDLYPAHSLQGL